MKHHFVLLFIFTLSGDGVVECEKISIHLSEDRPKIKQVGKEEFLFCRLTDVVILKYDVTSAAPPDAGSVRFLSKTQIYFPWRAGPTSQVHGSQVLQARPEVLPCSDVNMSEEQG